MRTMKKFVLWIFLYVSLVSAGWSGMREDVDRVGIAASKKSVDDAGAKIYVLIAEKLPPVSGVNDFNPVDYLRSYVSESLGGLKPRLIKSMSEAEADKASYLMQIQITQLQNGRSVRGNWIIPYASAVASYKILESADGKWKKVSAGNFRFVNRSNPLPAVLSAVYGGALLTVKNVTFKPLSGVAGKTRVTGKLTNNSSLAATNIYINCLGGASSAYVPFESFPVEGITVLQPGETVSFSADVDTRFDPTDSELGLQARDWAKPFISCAVWVKPEATDVAAKADDKKAGKGDEKPAPAEKENDKQDKQDAKDSKK